MDGGISPWAIYFSYLCIELVEIAPIVQIVSMALLLGNWLGYALHGDGADEGLLGRNFRIVLYIFIGVSSLIEILVPTKEVVLAMIQTNNIPQDNVELFRKEVIDMLRGTRIK